MIELTSDQAELVECARRVREHAYAPYSQFKVGAALRSTSGKIFVGCNVENASYGATICAERSAVVQMISAGEQRLHSVCVFTDAESLAMPCGMCRQVLAEFGLDVTVVVASPSAHKLTTLRSLLPEPFVLEP